MSPQRFPGAASIWTLIRLLPRVSRRRTAALAASTVLVATLPLAAAIASGLLIGQVPAAAAAGPGSPESRQAYLLLAAAAFAFVAAGLAGHAHGAVARNLGRELELLLQDRLARAVARPTGIGHLEDEEVLALLRIARQLGMDWIRPANAVHGVAAIAPQFIGAAGAAIVLAAFNVWIGLAWLLAWPAVFVGMQIEFGRIGRMVYTSSGEMRETEYLRSLAMDAEPAKEIRVWGLLDWLLDRYDRRWSERMGAHRRGEQVRPLTVLVVIGALLALTAATTLTLVDAGLSGAVGFGAIGVYAMALHALFNFSAFDEDAALTSYGALPVPKILDLERRLASQRRATGAELAPEAPQRSIRFERIGFTYPDARQPVFDGLDLEIEVGRSLAVVGDNGAGKTSLVKLLAGLYEPDAGRVLVDGADLAGIDPADWRTRLSALFQDFTRYQLTVRENITLGAPHLAAETDLVWKACEPMGIRALVESLPDGLDTVLSGQVQGGTDLSGGQWQRIALARALFAVEAGAKVLILDEPAAALDVRAEAELYEQFLDITAGLTTIVISHRYSTVRRADRIVVLDGGTVVEDGDHERLMALGGRYARAFTLQADRLAR
ncbi:ABC transporter ATP-binding protein [Glycomyces paridis]|uniref:ATP-binding cassette domain-containing protein n=1 Tax=Glycomyces paridis TaxID=2126555 RepID=A0A4S8PGD8_9ACTN|nr:ATP-binding cassette domain-containing protein [Glycomyces paridis]THV29587.1 ATP-binding cassette domain-containing protein [Glycomyces paridis]